MNDKIVCAALLHDIGKLIMRASGEKRPHSLVGYDYLNDKDFDSDITFMVSHHHAYTLKDVDNNSPAFIVYEADNISSAIDRRENINADSYEENDCEWKSDIPLKTVFSSFKHKNGEDDFYYPLRDLNPDNKINYPSKNCYASQDKYKELKSVLDENLRKNININSLLELLEDVMSYVPSSTNIKENVDISLFDHSKTTAAIASCIYNYFKENNIDDYKGRLYPRSNEDEKYYILLSGDISGVQDFIYTISSKGALKSLRARSFYLEIMLEHIVDEICGICGATRANLLYNGGGHFYMLLPNTQSVKTSLKEAEAKINQWFLEQFDTDLYLAAEYVEACGKDLKSTQNLFKDLNDKLSKKKLARYSKAQLKYVLTPHKLKAQRECTVCSSSSKETKVYESLGECCPVCYRLFTAGRDIIKDNEHISVISDDTGDALPLPSLDENNKFLVFKRVDNAIRCYTKNQPYTGENYATNLYIGDYNFRVNDNEPIDFSELSESAEGIKRLAVLRCDVDNLGDAFISGFDEKYAAISRVASLSRNLSLFFKFYINKICRGELNGNVPNGLNNFYLNSSSKSGEKKIVIVYSGGDDVFVVGAWMDVINFAVDLRNAFNEFTCGKLTFSAGIGLFSPKYPISQIALNAGRLEDLAKEYDNGGVQKDAVSLFGIDENTGKNHHTYHWNEFSENVYEKVLSLQNLCFFDEKKADLNKDKVFFSTSMMYKFKQLLEENGETASEAQSDINIARFAYTLSRMLGEARYDNDKNTALKENAEEFKRNLYYWALNDKKSFLTALELLIYLNRNE